MKVARPLRARLQLGITAAVLVFGALNVLLVGQVTYRALRGEQDRRLHFVARLVAQNASRPILVDDRVGIHRLVDESRHLDTDLAYIEVVSSTGELLARSLDGDVPGSTAARVGFREATEPIFDGRLGHVRVGIEERSLRAALGRVVSVVALMVLVFLVAGTFGAALLARSITRPVERLVEVSSGLQLDGEIPSLDLRSEDEIALLAERFKEMAERLQSLHTRGREHERALARVEHLAVVGTLAAGVAHEINNPLAGIRTAVERLLRKGPPEEAERYGPVLRDALNRIERAVKGTLRFASASEVHPGPIEPLSAVEKALLLAGPRFEEARIVLEQELASFLPVVRADEDLLGQAVLNLLLNACDAVGRGGRIMVRATRDSASVLLDVEDSGPGVPEAIRDQIFLPFFTTKPLDRGTGLGLAVSRAAVVEMGGDLTLEPSAAGACFRIRLPIWQDEVHGSNPSR